MRILIASSVLPWPLNSGGNAVVYSTLQCLAADHQFTFVCPVWNEKELKHAAELQAHLPLVRVRAVHCGEDLSSVQRRPGMLLRAARWCVRRGRRFLSAPPAKDKSPALYYPFWQLPEKFLTVLGEELSKGVDLFQAEFAEMSPLGSWLPKDLPKLFVHHQIHFLYAQRFLNARGTNSHTSYLASIIRVQELAYLEKFDGVIVFSENDRETLLPHLGPGKLFTSPPPVPSDIAITDDVTSVFDNRFVFVASEEHGPNRDGLEWLLAEIWPEIRTHLPSSTLDVVGEWSRAGRAAFSAPGVNFTGFVPDLSAVLRGSIMLVPIRIGSGVRIKILAAMAQGVPTVSTAIGCEGLLVRDGRDIVVRDGTHEFASAAIALATDPSSRFRVASAAKDAVSKHYSQQGVRRRRNEIYASVIANASKEPSAAVVGAKSI